MRLLLGVNILFIARGVIGMQQGLDIHTYYMLSLSIESVDNNKVQVQWRDNVEQFGCYKGIPRRQW